MGNTRQTWWTLVLHMATIQLLLWCQTLDVASGQQPEYDHLAQWSGWTVWSSCSSTCGPGTMTRSRQCGTGAANTEPGFYETRVKCKGSSHQIRACKAQPCDDSRLSEHQIACSKYNSRVFSGRSYVWEPFTHPTSPCKMACRARGEHFYANLAGQVPDGTSCGKGTAQAICVRGACMSTGCDNIVGSSAARDTCGVCLGDGSTCKTITGIFTSTTLRRGLNDIIIIPAGSSNINITELSPSRNMLLLQTFAGRTILNGGGRSPVSGKVKAAGTVFTYSSKTWSNPRESISAPGPIETGLKLKLLLRGTNPGIQYSFSVPMENSNKLLNQADNRAQPISLPTSEDEYRERMGTSSLEAFPTPTRREEQPADYVGPSKSISPGGGSSKVSSAEYGKDEPRITAGSDIDDSSESESDMSESESDEFSDESSSESSELGGPDFSNEDDDYNAGLAQNDEADEEGGEGGEDESVDEGGYENLVDNGGDVVVEEGIGEGVEEERDVDEELETEDQKLSQEEQELEEEELDEEELELQLDEDELDEEEEEYDEYLREIERQEDLEEKQEEEDDEGREEGDGDLGVGEEEEKDAEGNQVNDIKYDDTPENELEQMEEIEEEDEEEEEEEEDVLGNDSEEEEQYEDTVEDGNNNPSAVNSHTMPKYSQSFTFGERHDTMGSKRQPEGERQSVSPVETRAHIRRPGQIVTVGLQYVDENGDESNQGSSRTFNTRQQSSNDRRDRYSNRRRVVQGGPIDDPDEGVERGNVDTRYIRFGGSSSNGQTGAGNSQQSRRYQTMDTRLQNRRDYEQRRDPHSEYLRQQREREEERRRQREAEIEARRQRIERQRESYNKRLREYQERLRRHEEMRAAASRNREYYTRQEDRRRQQNGGRRTNGNSWDPIRSYYEQPTAKATASVYVTTRNRARRYGEDGLYASTDRSAGSQPYDRDNVITQRQRPTYQSSTGTGDSSTLQNAAIIPRVNSQPNIIPRTRTAGDLDTTGGRRPTIISALSSGGDDTSTPDRAANEVPLVEGSPYSSAQASNIIPSIDSSLTNRGRRTRVNSLDGSRVAAYDWKIAGLTKCSVSCGGGVQQTVVVCVDTTTQAVVTDDNCRYVTRPDLTGVQCNKRPCPAEWSPGSWSSCTASCGRGQRTRVVLCKARVSPALTVDIESSKCRGQERPPTVEECNLEACATWQIGQWSKCSSRCGEGVSTRRVKCIDLDGGAAPEEQCQDRKPDQEKACDNGPCGQGWVYQEWPVECPVECGAGYITRKIFCTGDSGEVLPHERCDPSKKPQERKRCRAASPCGGHWFTGPWSKCNAVCGPGKKSREVICVKALSGDIFATVGEENCVQEDKPAHLEPCQNAPCQPEWYMTSWGECSKECDTGHRTREIKCLGPEQALSDQCPYEDRPRTRESCNKHRCSQPTSSPDTQGSKRTDGTSDCTDQFSQCPMVKNARLCRYKFYKTRCCKSCLGED